MSPLPQSGWKWETTWMKDTTEKLLIVLYMKYSRYLKLMSEGNTMNDAIAMMFSILIVMFGYLVFKIRTDQSQSTTASTRKRSKKRGTGKPVIKNNWNMRPLDTKDPADKDLRYEDFVESSWKEIEKYLSDKLLYKAWNPCYIELRSESNNCSKAQKTPWCDPGAFCC